MTEVVTTNPYTSVDSGSVRVVDRSGATIETRTYSGGVLTSRRITGSEEARKKSEAQYQYNRQVEMIKKAGYSPSKESEKLAQLGQQFRSNPLINPFKSGTFEFEFYQRVGSKPSESNIGREAFKNFQEGRYKSWSEFESDNPALFVDPALRQAFSEAFSQKLQGQLQQYELAKLFKGQVKPTSEEKSEYLKSLSPEERAKVERLGLEPVLRPMGFNIATPFVTEKEAQRMAKIFPATKTEIAYLPLTPESKALVKAEQQKELREERIGIGKETIKTPAGMVLAGVVPISFPSLAFERAVKGEKIPLSETFYETYGGLVQNLQTGEKSFLPRLYRAGIGVGETVGGVFTTGIVGGAVIGGVASIIAPKLLPLITKLPKGFQLLGKFTLSKPFIYGSIILPTALEVVPALKEGKIAKATESLLKTGLFIGGMEISAGLMTPKKVSQSIQIGKIREAEGLAKVESKVITKIEYPFSTPIYQKTKTFSLIKTVSIPEQQALYSMGLSISDKPKLIGTTKAISKAIPIEDIYYTKGISKYFTPTGERIPIAFKSLSKAQEEYVSAISIAYGKQGKLGEQVSLFKREAEGLVKVPIKSIELDRGTFSLGKKGQLALTRTQQIPKPQGVLELEGINILTPMGQRIELETLSVAGAIKTSILSQPKLSFLVAPSLLLSKTRELSMEKTRQKELTMEKTKSLEKQGLKERLLLTTIPATKIATATKTTTKPTTTTKIATLTTTTTKTTPRTIEPKPKEPEPTIVPMGLGLPTLKEGKKRKMTLFKFKGKKLKRKIFVAPMPDPLSLLRTEATTFKPARQLPITREQAKKFARAYSKSPLTYNYPTFEMAKGIVGKKKRVK